MNKYGVLCKQFLNLLDMAAKNDNLVLKNKMILLEDDMGIQIIVDSCCDTTLSSGTGSGCFSPR